MRLSRFFTEGKKEMPFENYEEYVNSLFFLIDFQLEKYMEQLKKIFATGNGGVKNVLYPDLEVAHDLCTKHVFDFSQKYAPETEEEIEEEETQEKEELPDELVEFLSQFSEEEGAKSEDEEEEEEEEEGQGQTKVEEILAYIEHRAEQTPPEIKMPLYQLSKALKLAPFSIFCLGCAILSSTQTNYASVFQVINQNGSFSMPTIESAARVFYGKDFSITVAYKQMSRCIEQLRSIILLRVREEMPFLTGVSPDKRLIDYLFGRDEQEIDVRYKRFLRSLTKKEVEDPVMANANQLEAIEISFASGVRIFSLWGDEGSGRKFFIQHFCKKRGMGCLVLECKKLFSYDFSFIEGALWAVSRECILSNACCCLDTLEFHEEEKERFAGYIDLAVSKLREQDIIVFTVTETKIALRDMIREEFTQLELPTPTAYERLDLWKYYAKPYTLHEDVDLDEMATKFLFTAGKIKNALHQGKSLSDMQKYIDVQRSCLFESCYNQMKHELTQKATKVKATYTWDDIVMPPDQRQTLEYVCDQMKYRKQVYEKWDYNRKYPYGRGLSVLLFGAPGTGKSMCAQVIANALNLELYRVDLSKVIDKYVGETEKSISMIFREAKKCNVVLFFDEADTMFGKRTDKGEAGESSANNKTAHLLQEVEAYDGVTVLATNYKHNIDPAFFRRMKFIVEFQFPDPETRYRIWEATIPKNTPLAEDVDLHFLADRFEFVGGNIKNCILNAAFFAAGDGDGGEVSMKHYLMAVKYEFIKTGKVFAKSDFEPYAKLLGF